MNEPLAPSPVGPREGAHAKAEGVLAVDKPLDWTSHDVVAVLRGLLGLRRVGHGGTLDPLATGVLIILVGAATRDTERLHSSAKAYDALVRFGTETATDDREGLMTREAPVPAVSRDALDLALAPFRGTIEQVPPDYAAVKVGGQPAYARARAGETQALAPRRKTIQRLATVEWSPPELRLLVVCSSGTYIRALARDIGRALGSAAHLGGLRRIAVGGFDLDRATPLDALRVGGCQAATERLAPLSNEDLLIDRRFLHDAPGSLVDRVSPSSAG